MNVRISDETWRKRTMVHMAAPNIQWCSMVVVKVNGMQKIAMVRSATARLMRNARRSVRDRRPTSSTMMTITLPVTARTVVDVYRAISTYWCSSGRPGSWSCEAVVESFFDVQCPASVVISSATIVHVIVCRSTLNWEWFYWHVLIAFMSCSKQRLSASCSCKFWPQVTSLSSNQDSLSFAKLVYGSLTSEFGLTSLN